MMDGIKVTVVVPVYNGERFLRETLSTILSQTLKEIEVIIVDDGSTDKSLEVVLEIQQHDERLIVLKQENSYCGVARNLGMSIAKGKYIIFWDCDDLFKENALELMYNEMEKFGAEICVCNVEEFDDKTKKTILRNKYLNTKVVPKSKPFNKYDFPSYFFNFTSNNVWNKMYLLEFVKKNDIQFDSVDFSEDVTFVCKLLYLAEKITFIDKRLVRYRVNNCDSAMEKQSEKKTKYYDVLSDFVDWLKSYGEYELFEETLKNKCLASLLSSLEGEQNFEIFEEIFEKLKTEILLEFNLLDFSDEICHNKNNLIKRDNLLSSNATQYLLWSKKFNEINLRFEIEEKKREIKKYKSTINEIKAICENTKK